MEERPFSDTDARRRVPVASPETAPLLFGNAPRQGAVPPASRPPPRLGKYRLLAELGGGGMANVYLAHTLTPTGLSKVVALKLLQTRYGDDDDMVKLLLAEARVGARLNHANIVQTYDVGEEGGRHCIVMEYLEGRSMAELARAMQGRIPFPLGVRILADALAGLHHAHELPGPGGRPLGLVHRDIAPDNVFVTYHGHVKVLDFGVAKGSTATTNTPTGGFRGKVRYAAPERVWNEACDRRADIFSVGVMLWQLLTQQELWPGASDIKILHEIASGTPIPPPRSLNPRVPVVLDAICMRALAFSRANRFQTAAELQEALEGFLARDPKGSNRALGALMTELFAEERVRFQRTVEARLQEALRLAGEENEAGSVRADPPPSARAEPAPAVPPSSPGARTSPTLSNRRPGRRRGDALAAAATTMLGLAAGVGFVGLLLRPALRPAPRTTSSLTAATVSAAATVPAAATVSASARVPAAAAPSASVAPAPIATAAASPVPVAVATAPSDVPTAPASATAPRPAPTTGELVTPAHARGHRVFVDGRYAAPSSGTTLTLRCGAHVVRIGSKGREHTVDVPCGGSIALDDDGDAR